MSGEVTRELARMSNTVRGIGQDASRFGIAKEKLGLEGALQDFNMSRTNKADLRADELHEQGEAGRELQQGQDEKALGDYNAPVNAAMILGSPQGADRKPPLFRQDDHR